MMGLTIAGLDEVGRGPIAGPVVAAAVVLDRAAPITGLRDSKTLSESKRRKFDLLIRERSTTWALGRAEVDEIDRMNILQASLLAMKRAFQQLRPDIELALIDGNRLPELPCPAEFLIKGDQRVGAIQAAAILAKVARDAEMCALDEVFPDYGFAQHKGYPTRAHLKALSDYGLTPHHRLSFGPCKALVT